MKKVLWFVVVSILCYGCNQGKGVVTSEFFQEKAIDTLIKTELLKENLNDTIFLDFTFSMSALDYIEHALNLHSKKKIEYLNPDFNYKFDFGLSETYSSRVIPEFYRDTLYKLSIKAIPDEEQYNDGISFMDSFLNIMTDKYGDDYLLHSRKYGGEKQWRWINGKRFIELTYEGKTVLITYEDIEIKQYKKNVRDSIEEIEIENRIKDYQEKQKAIKSDL